LRDPAFNHFGTVSASDGQTDVRTDRQIQDDSKYRAKIASRGKK